MLHCGGVRSRRRGIERLEQDVFECLGDEGRRVRFELARVPLMDFTDQVTVIVEFGGETFAGPAAL